MPHGCKVSDQHHVTLRVREVLLQLRSPVERGQRTGKIYRLGIAGATPDCVPHKDDEVGDCDPLVAKEKARVAVDEEGGGGGGGGVGHGGGCSVCLVGVGTVCAGVK